MSSRWTTDRVSSSRQGETPFRRRGVALNHIVEILLHRRRDPAQAEKRLLVVVASASAAEFSQPNSALGFRVGGEGDSATLGGSRGLLRTPDIRRASLWPERCQHPQGSGRQAARVHPCGFFRRPPPRRLRRVRSKCGIQRPKPDCRSLICLQPAGSDDAVGRGRGRGQEQTRTAGFKNLLGR